MAPDRSRDQNGGADEIRVVQLPLGMVKLPATHPRAHESVAEIYAHVVLHPAGPVLIDTGPGRGHPIIDEMYRPTVIPIAKALSKVGLATSDILAVVNTHLHFDHCGQNGEFPGAPVWVQSSEVEAARAPGYTVPEWASIPEDRLRALDGDATVVDGVGLVATPGHTVGHQSVVVDGPEGAIVLAGQCCYTCDDFANGVVSPDNIDEAVDEATALASLERLRSFDPVEVHVSHDRSVLRSAGGAFLPN